MKASEDRITNSRSALRKTRPKKRLAISKPAITKEAFKVLIGPPKLTRFERARIIGARSLQLALGAPPFISLKPEIKDPISLATAELESKVLPISIRRALPDGSYQDIPLDLLV